MGFPEARLDDLAADEIELVRLAVVQGQNALAPVNAYQEADAFDMRRKGAGLDQIVGVALRSSLRCAAADRKRHNSGPQCQ